MEKSKAGKSWFVHYLAFFIALSLVDTIFSSLGIGIESNSTPIFISLVLVKAVVITLFYYPIFKFFVWLYS
ncbi:hypothetical protein ACQKE0_06895 [Shewanella colwelliana]|uniref:hypothetical protein n=1 Tax=Shewanella colwelliana TaxID=23 RepID=UPI003D056B33